MTLFEQRRGKLLKILRSSGNAGILVTDPSNVTYLTGFTGEDSFLLLSPTSTVVISDSRFATQLEEECPGLDLEIRRQGVSLATCVATVLNKARLHQVAFEADVVAVGQLERFRAARESIDWQPTSGLVEQLREIKDKGEIAAIRNAVTLAERAFAVGRASLVGTQTEREFAYALENQIRTFGGQGCSFETIVAVGDRAALAHYRPGSLRIANGSLLLIDWGALSCLYRSDLTRVLVTGKPTRKLEQVYTTVLKAQKAAIKTIRPGVTLESVDTAARKIIEEAGFGKKFGHSLGHGIGLDIHEEPRVAQGQKRALKAGMVITVEPGIYLPGWGGVRIEDDVLVTRSGHEVLSSVPKEFEDCFQEPI